MARRGGRRGDVLARGSECRASRCWRPADAMAPTRRLVLHTRRRSCGGGAGLPAGFGDVLHTMDAPRVACAQPLRTIRCPPRSVEPARDRAVRMGDGLRKVQRIYDQDPDAYHRAMSPRFSAWL